MKQAVALAAMLSLVGCASVKKMVAGDEKVRVIAESPLQWTGVAVLEEKGGDLRMFVNYPRWSDVVPISLAEVPMAEGRASGVPVIPYPTYEINHIVSGSDPATTFICVQSVVTGPGKKLFVLDPANPQFGGVVAGGAKLVVIDPKTKRIQRIYPFGPEIAKANSYLNDIRFDASGRWAFMTDSGAGALVVLDLETGKARRLLDGHPSTQAEDTEIIIDGRPVRIGGAKPVVHADGLAVDKTNGWVYWQALTGRTLYRLPVSALIDESATPGSIEANIERVAEVGPSDGLECDSDGAVYLTSLEKNAIRRWREGKGIDVVAEGPEFRWPDSLAWGADGSLYVNCSQIHLGPGPKTPYVIVKIPANVVKSGTKR